MGSGRSGSHILSVTVGKKRPFAISVLVKTGEMVYNEFDNIGKCFRLIERRRHMAYDEELLKRREQREKLRQKRLAEHKKMMTKLIIAGVALVLCAVVIFLVMDRTPAAQPDPTVPPATDPQATAGATDPVPTSPTAPSATQMEDTTVIHFTAAGDVTVTDNTAHLNFGEALQDVLPILCAGDLTVVNFEGNLIGAPYGAESASAPQTLMESLFNAGVDLVQMANSRSIYNGLSGLNTTLHNIRAAGLEPVGAWSTNEEAKESGGYTIREVNGVRIAVVAFTKGMDSMALPAGSENCVNVLYKDYATVWQEVDSAGITKILKAVQREKPDITIALVHWGSEYRDQISDTQTVIKDLMLANGVDAIIGTHPHYVQAMEYDNEAGTFVAYSLGDLLGDGETAGTEYGVILDLEITKDNLEGTTKITGYRYTPIFNSRMEGQPIRILRLEEAIRAYENGYMYRVSQELYEDMVYAQTRVAQRVHPEEE